MALHAKVSMDKCKRLDLRYTVACR